VKFPDICILFTLITVCKYMSPKYLTYNYFKLKEVNILIMFLISV